MEDLRLVWLYSQIEGYRSAIRANAEIASRLSEIMDEECWELLNLQDNIDMHKRKRMEEEARRKSSWRFSNRKPFGMLFSSSPLPGHELTVCAGSGSYTRLCGLHGVDSTEGAFQLFALPRQSLGFCNSRRSEPQSPLVPATSTCVSPVELPVTTSYVEEDFGLVCSPPSETLLLPAPVSQPWLPLVIYEVPEVTMTEDESVINDIEMTDAPAEVLDAEDLEMADVDPEDLEMDNAPSLALLALDDHSTDLDLSTILERINLGPQDVVPSPAAPGQPLTSTHVLGNVLAAPSPRRLLPPPKSSGQSAKSVAPRPKSGGQSSKLVAPVPKPSVPSPKPAAQSPNPRVQPPKPPVKSSKPATPVPKPSVPSPKPAVPSPKPAASSPKAVPASASLRKKFQPKAKLASAAPSPAPLPMVEPPRSMCKGKSKAKPESSAPSPATPSPFETPKPIRPSPAAGLEMMLQGGPKLKSPSPGVAPPRKFLKPKSRRMPGAPESPVPLPVQPPKVQSKPNPEAPPPKYRTALPIHASEWPVSQSRLRNVCRTMVPRLRSIILDFPEFFGMPITEVQAFERHAEDMIASQLAFESFGGSLSRSEASAYILFLFFEGGESSIVNFGCFPNLDDEIAGRIFEQFRDVCASFGITGLPSALDPIYGDQG